MEICEMLENRKKSQEFYSLNQYFPPHANELCIEDISGAGGSFVQVKYQNIRETILHGFLGSMLLGLGTQVESNVARIRDHDTEIIHLKGKCSDLEKRIARLETTENREVDVEGLPAEVSKEKAKEMIVKLFEQEGELDYVDIASALGLDLKSVVEICSELEREKRIEEVE